MLEVAAKEGLKSDQKALELVCETFGNDIRQILNFLQMWKSRSNILKYDDAQKGLVGGKKDESVMITGLDAAAKLLNRMEVKHKVPPVVNLHAYIAPKNESSSKERSVLYRLRFDPTFSPGEIEIIGLLRSVNIGQLFEWIPKANRQTQAISRSPKIY